MLNKIISVSLINVTSKILGYQWGIRFYFIETQLIKAFPYMFKTWHRYVDNIFAVIPNRHVQDALKLLNIQDNSLRFTLETEIDGPFWKLQESLTD